MTVLAFPRTLELDANGLPKDDRQARFMARQALLEFFNELWEWNSVYYLEHADAEEGVNRALDAYWQWVLHEHPSQRGKK